ncbi:MAG: hypothetical protein IKW00_01635 [Clostridia bacterium]|nr:hypothetical protein [Clostridia bacterium]
MDKNQTKGMTPYPEKDLPRGVGKTVRRVCIALAVLLIVLGILNGGLWDVLVKAVNICTECIGLG